MMKLLKLLQYNKEITLNQVKKLNSLDLKYKVLDKLLMPYMMRRGNSLDAARHPLQIVQIKVNHPIYPKNMMRKEIR